MIQPEIIESGKTGLVFVDLDRCLLREDSIRAIAEELIRRRIFGRSLFLPGTILYLQYRLNLRDPEPLVRYGVKRLKGTPYDLIEEISYFVYQRYLKNRYHSLLLAELEEHLSQGRKVYLLTGGLPPIPLLVKQEFHFTGVFSTIPELEEGRFTGRILEPPCVGKGKVVYAQRACEETGGVLAHSWFYTDSLSDLPLLRIVEHPVAVEPDPFLTFYALKEGWKILKTQSPF